MYVLGQEVKNYVIIGEQPYAFNSKVCNSN